MNYSHEMHIYDPDCMMLGVTFGYKVEEGSDPVRGIEVGFLIFGFGLTWW